MIDTAVTHATELARSVWQRTFQGTMDALEGTLKLVQEALTHSQRGSRSAGADTKIERLLESLKPTIRLLPDDYEINHLYNKLCVQWAAAQTSARHAQLRTAKSGCSSRTRASAQQRSRRWMDLTGSVQRELLQEAQETATMAKQAYEHEKEGYTMLVHAVLPPAVPVSVYIHMYIHVHTSRAHTSACLSESAG